MTQTVSNRRIIWLTFDITSITLAQWQIGLFKSFLYNNDLIILIGK